MRLRAYLGLLVGAATLAVLPMATGPAQADNGAPSGAHYDLNIIGVPKGKTADGTGSSGQRIFVSLDGNTKILLYPGPDFQVLDYNGTDGTAAFQLPNPDPTGTGTTTYAVYVRALGKPGGTATATSGFTDSTGTTWLSTTNVVLVRGKGQSSFTNVSKQLLSVTVSTGTTSLFADPLSQYFWDWSNTGLKLVQMRFYQLP